MRFCPKCGSIMVPRRRNGRTYAVCPRCGYEEEITASTVSAYVIRKEIKHTNKEKIVVIDENVKMPRIASIAKGVECPKCGNREAYVWMMQTRAADEPPTRFYRCTKCGYTWREYE